MDAAAAGARSVPRGRLRVDVGSSLANLVIIPNLPDFRARYPEVELQLGVSDRPVDLIGEGVDCVIRGGALADTSLIARRLCTLDSVTCATPAYLAAYGVPAHPAELESGHVAITYRFPQTGKALPLHFTKGAESHAIHPHATVGFSESTAHTNAVLAGLGIGQIFGFGAAAGRRGPAGGGARRLDAADAADPSRLSRHAPSERAAARLRRLGDRDFRASRRRHRLKLRIIHGGG